MAFEKSVVIDSKSMAQSEWQQMPEFVHGKAGAVRADHFPF
jgi:hypothetical protein